MLADRPVWIRLGLVGLVLCSTSGCDTGLSSPDTETGPAVRRGTVTDESGAPIAGARVFWRYPGLISTSGDLLVPDSALSDGDGKYRLETVHYCNSQLAAVASGYLSRFSGFSYLACPDNQPEVVDITLAADPAG